MRVHYTIEALGPLHETPLESVPFETVQECPVCGSEKFMDVAVLENSLTSAWCHSCSHLFHRKRPTQEWHDHWYQFSWDKPTLKKTFFHRLPQGVRNLLKRVMGFYTVKRGIGFSKPGDKMREIFEFCRPVISPRSKVLDIGCGYGNNLFAFVQYGCTACGVDPSPHRAKAATFFGIRATNIPIERLELDTFQQRFDLVISNHVLEHVLTPHLFLSSIRRVLSPGGWICITVPNVENYLLLEQFFYALHAHCFSRESLTTLLEANKFLIHRVTEDFQIRVLAQYRPDAKDPVNPRSLLNGDRLSPLKEFIFTKCLGPDYERYEGQKIFCQWEDLASLKKLKYHHHVSYSSEKYPTKEGGVVRFSWEGPRELPIYFFKEGDKKGAPFWVK